MGYTYSQEDAIRFLRERGLEYRVNGGEYAVRRCPYCGGGRSGRDEWTFALNIEKGVFRCLRASCDAHGHFVELARDFDFPLGGSAVSYRPLAEPTEKSLSAKRPSVISPNAASKAAWSRGMAYTCTGAVRIRWSFPAVIRMGRCGP